MTNAVSYTYSLKEVTEEKNKCNVLFHENLTFVEDIEETADNLYK